MRVSPSRRDRRALDGVLDRVAGDPTVGDEDVAQARPLAVRGDVRVEARRTAERGGRYGHASLQRHAVALRLTAGVP